MHTDVHNRVWGDKDIAGKIEVTSSNNSLQILVGEDDYSITVPTGTYRTVYSTHSSDIVNTLNQLFDDELFLIDVLLGRVHRDEKLSCLVFKDTEGREITSLSGSFVSAFM